mmetsp:Transcript_42525/g.96706  ORF Transcript_42525/g.96706 Transcript_42525/m.96706 type:complete len:318 (-) Transcript_42525:90-1043(-)
MGSADVGGTSLQQEPNIPVHLLLRRRGPGIRPLGVVIPPVQLHHLPVHRQPVPLLPPLAQAKPLHHRPPVHRHRHGVQLGLPDAPHPGARHGDLAQGDDPGVGLALDGLGGGRGVELEGEVDRAGAGGVGECDVQVDFRQAGGEDVGPPGPDLPIIRHVMEQYTPDQPPVHPEVPPGVQRGRSSIEPVVREHHQFPVPGAVGQIHPEWGVPPGSAVCYGLPVDKNSAVEGAGHKLQPGRPSLLELGPVDPHTPGSRIPWQRSVHGRRHRRGVRGGQLRRPDGPHAVKTGVFIEAILPSPVQHSHLPISPEVGPEWRG